MILVRSVAARGAASASVVLLKGGLNRLDLVPDTASTDTAAHWVHAEPCISLSDQAGDTARIAVSAIHVELGGDQLLREQVGLILASAMTHDREGLRLGVVDAPKLDCLHAPSLWVGLPVAVAEHASTLSRTWSR